ncbi:unnamed protein product [Ceratitis capitata]|uniref:(Mediterranean fruit fly) hypothetical protein n=1 Tax=Ceratitis capitata TaxID=7213 RepID=A0A811ULS2_CERCA|nr:unnamed protein product [Ceratitis capitata]
MTDLLANMLIARMLSRYAIQTHTEMQQQIYQKPVECATKHMQAYKQTNSKHSRSSYPTPSASRTRTTSSQADARTPGQTTIDCLGASKLLLRDHVDGSGIIGKSKHVNARDEK